MGRRGGHHGAGDALVGSASRDHVLNFVADQLPEAKRFWSLTAYTPDSIELIRDPAREYAVARYTPDSSTIPTNPCQSTLARG